MLARGGTQIFSDTSPWESITPILAEDPSALFAVNLESPIGEFNTVLDPSITDMNLCADASQIRVLADGGIDFVTNANNHQEDCLSAGTSNAAQALRTAGIGVAATSDVVYALAGKQNVAFIALDAYSSEADLTGLLAEIRFAHDNSDLVVVSIHWGNEYQAGPSHAQEDLAQELVDAGADVVWGHHPHVLQRMEWRASSVDGHHALVMYSLGNLLADQWMLTDAMRTAIVHIEFSRHEIESLLVIPLEMDVQTRTLQLITQNEMASLVTERLGLADLDMQGVHVEVWGDQ